MISQAINQTIEVGANYICNAKFEGLSYQWQAMYGTAVKANYWHNRTDENNPENATIVSELPDYDNYDDNDGSGSLQNTTTLYPSTLGLHSTIFLLHQSYLLNLVMLG